MPLSHVEREPDCTGIMCMSRMKWQRWRWSSPAQKNNGFKTKWLKPKSVAQLCHNYGKNKKKGQKKKIKEVLA